MKTKIMALIFSLGIGLMLTAILLVKVSSAGQIDDNNLEVSEADLNPSGEVFEVNADAEGNIWVSDFGAGELWQIDKSTSQYVRYEGLSGVSDARADQEGDVWWTDYSTQIGRLSPNSATITVWELPGAGNLWGTTIDRAGNIWAVDFLSSQLYRLDPSTNQLCNFAIPENGAGDYLISDGDQIWLADWRAVRLWKLDTTVNVFTSWSLPDQSQAEGMALETSGGIWWADEGLGVLSRFDPTNELLTNYSLPIGTKPKMMTTYRNSILYTEDGMGTLGTLDPAKTTGESISLNKETFPVTPICGDIGPGTNSTANTTSGMVSWATLTYTRTVDTEAWQIYQLPTDASPWGIAMSGNYAWIADRGRQKLIRILLGENIAYLPIVTK